jgi:hypothetical protein
MIKDEIMAAKLFHERDSGLCADAQHVVSAWAVAAAAVALLMLVVAPLLID